MKRKLILIFILVLAVVVVSLKLVHARPTPSISSPSPAPSSLPSQPQVISTNPPNLDGATIPPLQTIKITFDQPLRNPKEFNSKIDPQVDYSVSLDKDPKTVIIAFSKPLQLKAGYTLYIQGDTRFNATTTLGRELMFKFTTIDYSGV